PAFFFSGRRRHTRFSRDWSSDVCSSDLDAHLPASSGNCNVESSFASIAVERTEVHRYTPELVRAVSDREVNNISFITLHVLKVLYHQRFRQFLGKPQFKTGILSPLLIKQVFDQLLLLRVKGDNPDRWSFLLKIWIP